MAGTRRIKWGILGTNWISGVIAEAIQKSNTSDLIAVGSRDLSRATEFAKKYSVEKFYANYEKLLSDPEVEVVYIGLPNHLHKEWIIRCAKASKHILCEKPFVLNSAEAKEAFDEVKKHNVFCMEALMYRCHPFIHKLEELVESKIIGDLKQISATYHVNIAEQENKTAGGSIRSLGCYPVSLVRLLAKEEPERIFSFGERDTCFDTDTLSLAICHFKSGLKATITTSNSMDWWWQFTIFGTKGVLEVLTNPWLPGESNKVRVKIGEKVETLDFKAEKPLYTYQIDFIGEHIQNKLKSPSKHGVTWEHTFGNVAFLESWLTQVKNSKSQMSESKCHETEKMRLTLWT